MTFHRRFHPGASKATAPAILAVLMMQLVTSSDAFIGSLLGGAASSSPPPPSHWSCKRGCRRVTCDRSRQEAPTCLTGRGKGPCSNNGGSRGPASFNRLRSQRGNGDGGSKKKGDGGDAVLSITTFNVLAPIFKRVGNGRESEFREAYLERHEAIIEHLKVGTAVGDVMPASPRDVCPACLSYPGRRHADSAGAMPTASEL